MVQKLKGVQGMVSSYRLAVAARELSLHNRPRFSEKWRVNNRLHPGQVRPFWIRITIAHCDPPESVPFFKLLENCGNITRFQRFRDHSWEWTKSREGIKERRRWILLTTKQDANKLFLKPSFSNNDKRIIAGKKK